MGSIVESEHLLLGTGPYFMERIIYQKMNLKPCDNDSYLLVP